MKVIRDEAERRRLAVLAQEVHYHTEKAAYQPPEIVKDKREAVYRTIDVLLDAGETEAVVEIVRLCNKHVGELRAKLEAAKKA